MELVQLIYAGCSAAFLVLIGLMLLRARVSGRGLLIIMAAGLTAIWAASIALNGIFPYAVIPILDSLRLSAWLIVLTLLLSRSDERRAGVVPVPVLGAITFSAMVLGAHVGALIDARLGPELDRITDLLHVGLAVSGLFGVENILRNADEARRRKLWPFCFALGATFAFELFLYANSLMVPGAGPMLLDGRGLVGLLAVPFIAVTIVRNPEWGVDIHVSRTVVLHTAALVATGIFFLALSATAVLVRNFGGGWGPTLQVLVLLGSAIVLVPVLGARDLRIRLKDFISRHFFSNRFDYRAEWLRFVNTVSSARASDEHLPSRVVRALAQIIDSPAGALWQLEGGLSYSLAAAWNLAIGDERLVAVDAAFISQFQCGERVQVQLEPKGEPFRLKGAWVAVPLVHQERLSGFAILMLPHLGYHLDDEVFELLRTAGRQAGSYIAEEQSARALLDSRVITEFGKRVAFVVHDVKNLASQLGLTVANARRYLDHPEYREDMLATLEDAAEKLERLVNQLRGSKESDRGLVEPDSVIFDLAAELSQFGQPIQTRLQACDCAVRIDGEQLRSILHHILNNAREASQAGEAGSMSSVVVSSQAGEGKVTIDIVDNGPGMDDEFIRDELFRPFRSTKAHGLGIGAYQTRELLRMAGGDLDVISQKGVGTTFRMTLPLAKRLELISAA